MVPLTLSEQFLYLGPHLLCLGVQSIELVVQLGDRPLPLLQFFVGVLQLLVHLLLVVLHLSNDALEVGLLVRDVLLVGVLQLLDLPLVLVLLLDEPLKKPVV